jgi:hypothetical protein
MNCTTARELFPALLDARTAATEHLEARTHLAGCPECQREFAALSQTLSALDAMPTPQPSPRLRQNFYAMLEEEKHSAASIRAVARREHRASLLRWILAPAFGGALLVAGFFAGRQTPPAPTTTVATTTPSGPSTETLALREELQALRKQVEQNNVLMAYSILERQKSPASDRLEGVLLAARADQPDDKVLDSLLGALAFDPNINVRLRALQALYPHAERELVRTGVLAALPREQNPLVQIELIDFVATARTQGAQPVLEQMSQSQATDLSVRAAAKQALAQLTLSTTNNSAPATNGSNALN